MDETARDSKRSSVSSDEFKRDRSSAEAHEPELGYQKEDVNIPVKNKVEHTIKTTGELAGNRSSLQGNDKHAASTIDKVQDQLSSKKDDKSTPERRKERPTAYNELTSPGTTLAMVAERPSMDSPARKNRRISPRRSQHPGELSSGSIHGMSASRSMTSCGSMRYRPSDGLLSEVSSDSLPDTRSPCLESFKQSHPDTRNVNSKSEDEKESSASRGNSLSPRQTFCTESSPSHTRCSPKPSRATPYFGKECNLDSSVPPLKAPVSQQRLSPVNGQNSPELDQSDIQTTAGDMFPILQPNSVEEPDNDQNGTLNIEEEGSRRGPLQETVAEVSELDGTDAAVLFNDVNQLELEHISSIDNEGSLSSRQLTEIKSLDLSIGEISRREPTAHNTRRNNQPSGIPVFHEGDPPSDATEHQEAQSPLQGMPLGESAMERPSQVLGESAQAHSSPGPTTKEAAPAEPSEVIYVDAANLYAVDVAHTTSASQNPEESYINLPSAPNQKCEDENKQPEEHIMADEEEEEPIFLIKDDLMFPSLEGEFSMSDMAIVEIQHELPMHTARSDVTSGDESNAGISKEVLDFTFSYSDAVVIEDKEGDDSPPVGQEPLIAEESLSFGNFGPVPLLNTKPEAVSHLEARDEPKGKKLRVGDLEVSTSSSSGSSSDTTGSSHRPLTFSDRVSRFVASIRGEKTPETNEIVSLPENIMCNTSGRSIIREDVPEVMNERKTPIAPEKPDSITIPSEDSHKNVEKPMKEGVSTTEIHEPATGGQTPTTSKEPMDTATRTISADHNRLLKLQSPFSQVEDSIPSNLEARFIHSAIEAGGILSSSSSSNEVMNSPFGGSVTNYKAISPMATTAVPFTTTPDNAKVQGINNTLTKAKHTLEENSSPYDDLYGMLKETTKLPSSKRVKLANGKAAIPSDKVPYWIGLDGPVTTDASRLVHATMKSIKVIIGAKISEKGYDKTQTGKNKEVEETLERRTKHDFDDLSKSLTYASMPLSMVYEDTKSLMTEVIDKLKTINGIKEQLTRVNAATKDSNTVEDQALETYCSMARSKHRLARSIEESRSILKMQEKLIALKQERMNMLEDKIQELSRRQKMFKDLVPKAKKLDSLVADLSNIYAATGIKVVPITTGNKQLRWCFIISFNSSNNHKSAIRASRTWQKEALNAYHRALEAVLGPQTEYHRTKQDPRFNQEITMIAYLMAFNELRGDGILSSCTRSVSRLYNGSPEQDETSTPRARGYVPFYKSNEIPSNGLSSVRSTYGNNHVVCSINGPHSDQDIDLQGTEVVVEHTVDLDDPEHISPLSAFPSDASVSDMDWEEHIDLEDIRKCLKVVLTCQSCKPGAGIAKIYEKVLFLLIEASNKHLEIWKSQLQAKKHSIGLGDLIRDLAEQGSTLTARIRILQRELLQLLNSTSAADLFKSEDGLALKTILSPKEAGGPFLQLSISAKPADLLEKGSYTLAATEVHVSALLPEYKELAHSINSSLATIRGKQGTIYDTMVLACERNNHQL